MVCERFARCFEIQRRGGSGENFAADELYPFKVQGIFREARGGKMKKSLMFLFCAIFISGCGFAGSYDSRTGNESLKNELMKVPSIYPVYSYGTITTDAQQPFATSNEKFEPRIQGTLIFSEVGENPIAWYKKGLAAEGWDVSEIIFGSSENMAGKDSFPNLTTGEPAKMVASQGKKQLQLVLRLLDTGFSVTHFGVEAP
jgi:hypothetical protein